MDDYIRRNEAIDVLATMQGSCTSKAALVQNSKIWKQIKGLPSADVQPVRHGCFIGTEYDGYADGNSVFYEWKCSECGCIFENEEPTYNYCPNCGARMDGEKE